MKITRTLTLSCLTVASLFGTSLVETSMAGPLDKSSPKIAHGMYRDRGKSSPKIAHGMYRDRGKSSPKIAEGTAGIMEENIAGRTRRGPVTVNVIDMVDVYFDLLDVGEYELADEVGMEVEDLVRELGYWRGRR
jgi:hypothetical protein|tara:strand:+ start:658 stop:1059 length:402 start_codon:yes stop_codon:yes gene_type:complete